jgi:hypothetical protein
MLQGAGGAGVADAASKSVKAQLAVKKKREVRSIERIFMECPQRYNGAQVCGVSF